MLPHMHIFCNLCFTFFYRPFRYVRRPEFGYVFGTYGATYASKNIVDAVCSETKQSAKATAFYKFWIVFVINGGICVFWKDPGLARIFQNTNIKRRRKTPKAALATWVLRDVMHVIGAAVLPDYLEQLSPMYQY